MSQRGGRGGRGGGPGPSDGGGRGGGGGHGGRGGGGRGDGGGGHGGRGGGGDYGGRGGGGHRDGGDHGGRGGGGGHRGGGGGGGGGYGRPEPGPVRDKVTISVNMFSMDEKAIQTVVNKVFRYEITVLPKNTKPEDANKYVEKKDDKPKARMVRQLIYHMRRQPPFKGVDIVGDGSKILYSLQELEKAVKGHDSLVAGMEKVAIAEPVPEAAGRGRGRGKGKGKGKGKDPEPDPPVPGPPPPPGDAPLKATLIADGIVVDIQVPKGDTFCRVPLLIKRAQWNPDDKLQQSQMLQVAIKYSFYETYTDMIFKGRNMFKPGENVDIGGGILLFSGIFQSVRVNAVRKPMINVDLSYMLALNSNISVFQWVKNYASHNRFPSVDAALSNERFHAHLQQLLSDMLVQATYGSQAQYKLEGVATTNMNPDNVKFTNKKGEEMSISKYMTDTYKLKFQSGLLLLAKGANPKPSVEEAALSSLSSSSSSKPSKKPPSDPKKHVIYLIAEFMKLAPGQRRKGETTMDERNAMIDHTRKRPTDKMNEINKIVAEITSNLKKINIDLGINLKNTEVDCLVFRHKPIEYKQEQLMPENGGWNTKRLYSTPSGQQKWGIIHHSRLEPALLKEFITKFTELAKNWSLFLSNPVTFSIDGSLKSIQAAVGNYKSVSFFMCILDPEADRNIYHLLKEGSYVHTGVATQCVLDERTRKGKDWVKVLDTAVVRNLIAGVNAKLGGDACNYIVSEKAMQEILAPIKTDDLLVIGVDVYHGETLDKTKSSIAAMVVSKDKHFNKYYTTTKKQPPRTEFLVEGEHDNITPMIDEVFQATKKFPRNILIYRDGVGEGMYGLVLDREVTRLRLKVNELYAMKKLAPPKITFVIVQKRNHLRSVDYASYDKNPPPGTYVDDLTVIDEREGGDGEPGDNFYMYSHLALAGTARPTHYQIQLNEVGFAKRQLAEFTYALAHLHQGCTKSVSLPACVYYADLACYIAGTSFREKADLIKPNIKNTAYFV